MRRATRSAGRSAQQHLGLRDQVLAELRQRIIDAHYPPGERLTEDRLAADFGVSRNPVREALRIVATEGFVEMQPRRGAFVATPDECTMRDMFAARACWSRSPPGWPPTGPPPADVAAPARAARRRARGHRRGDFFRVAELNSDLHLHVIA